MKESTLQNDPNIKIPAAVRKAAERSDQLYNAYRDQPVDADGQVTPQGNPEGNQDGNQEGARDNKTPKNPDLSADSLSTGTPDSNKTDDQTADKTGDQAADKADDRADDKSQKTDPNDESWEHKYKSIHGRYVRSQEQVRTLTDRIYNLENLVATLQQEPEKKESKTPDLDPESLITDDERSDYGEDFLKVVGKRARQEVAPLIRGYEKEIEQLKRQLKDVDGFVQQSSQEKLLSELDAKLPKWREVNTNPEFLEWLGLPDPYSGAIRHNMLKAAYAQGDPHRVLAFFNGFLAEEAAVAPASKKPDPSERRVPKVPLENLAAPGRAKTAATDNVPAEKPFITRAQVSAFYADVAAGKYRGREEAKNKAEAEIFAAQNDGRIR